jgi:hypothetical protein
MVTDRPVRANVVNRQAGSWDRPDFRLLRPVVLGELLLPSPAGAGLVGKELDSLSLVAEPVGFLTDSIAVAELIKQPANKVTEAHFLSVLNITKDIRKSEDSNILIYVIFL